MQLGGLAQEHHGSHGRERGQGPQGLAQPAWALEEHDGCAHGQAIAEGSASGALLPWEEALHEDPSGVEAADRQSRAEGARTGNGGNGAPSSHS